LLDSGRQGLQFPKQPLGPSFCSRLRSF